VQVSGFKFFQVLPYIPPLNTDFLCKKLVNALQNKRVYLAGLANAEQECDELVKVLCPLLGDAEIKKLVQAHCNTERMDSLKVRYVKAVTSVKLDNFCLSNELST